MLTKKELAAEYKIGLNTIDRLLTKGLPHIKIVRGVRFDEEDVKRWLSVKPEERNNDKDKEKD